MNYQHLESAKSKRLGGELLKNCLRCRRGFEGGLYHCGYCEKVGVIADRFRQWWSGLTEQERQQYFQGRKCKHEREV